MTLKPWVGTSLRHYLKTTLAVTSGCLPDSGVFSAREICSSLCTLHFDDFFCPITDGRYKLLSSWVFSIDFFSPSPMISFLGKKGNVNSLLKERHDPLHHLPTPIQVQWPPMCPRLDPNQLQVHYFSLPIMFLVLLYDDSDILGFHMKILKIYCCHFMFSHQKAVWFFSLVVGTKIASKHTKHETSSGWQSLIPRNGFVILLNFRTSALATG